MTDPTPTFEVFLCPACGKPTTEALDTCRHCGAILRVSEKGAKRNRIIDTSEPGAMWGCIGTAVALAFLTAGGVTYCSYSSRQTAKLEAQQQAQEAKEDEARYQQRVISGEVCADGPLDLNTALELNVKGRLIDPDSFVHLGTVIKPSGDGVHYDALMRYRSRNALGGMVEGSAVGKLYVLERNVCEVRSFRILE